MKKREFRTGIWKLGAVHWDRAVFDALMPTPEGTSYNSYLIEGKEKTALIDTSEPETAGEFMGQLEKVQKVDFIVSLHSEQDHSGCLPLVLERYPEARLVTNAKGKEFLCVHHKISPERIHVVENGEKISLGGRSLKFFSTPWVHWPETMIAYMEEEKILFTCDLFGSHVASSSLFVRDQRYTYLGAKRYFAEIMYPFRKNIQKHLDLIRTLDVDIIAPSHGPMYDKPEWIIETYDLWVSDQPENLVLIPYITMHGSTRIMVDHLVSVLVEKGLDVLPINLEIREAGDMAMNLVDAATVVFATPTVMTGPHPAVVYAAYFMNLMRPKLRQFTVIGSYGWSSKSVEQIQALCSAVKGDFLPPVYTRGLPGEKQFKELDVLAEEIYRRHKEQSLIS